VRAWARTGVVLAGGFVAGSRVVGALEAWQGWRALAVSDPSAADLYRTTAWIDLGIAVVSVALAGLVRWLLRPPADDRLP
jgi:hypothetical protein